MLINSSRRALVSMEFCNDCSSFIISVIPWISYDDVFSVVTRVAVTSMSDVDFHV